MKYDYALETLPKLLTLPEGPSLKPAASTGSSYYSDLRITRVGRMMSLLLLLEWAGMIATAILLSPLTWSGGESHLHPHLWSAILSGPVFILPAILLTLAYPTRPVTRHAIAVAQMLVSSLLIDITGGRLETHFHIFGSLAFLAFYQDWRVLITASLITIGNHLIGGALWPEAVYGVLTVSPWRWVEHAWWVVFEDFFLIVGGMRESRFEWDAHHDALTALPNRRLLAECFGRTADGAIPGRKALLFIDLDQFKSANDALGHEVGDQLLKLVARRLAAAVGSRATLARVGGDEFVALIDRPTGAAEAIEIGNLTLAALSRPFRLDDHELMLSASVGISLCPEDGTELTTLQAAADKAMFVAKKQGRNCCVVFSSAIEARQNVLHEIKRDLYQALPRREFNLSFQPLIDRIGAVAGFEALLRWTHPVHGPVAPVDFIPVAEDGDLILGIGCWVLWEACRQCRSWQRPGRKPVGVAVNVSASQFELPDFPDKVMEALRQCDLDPALLTLELTEGVIVRNMSSCAKQLARLRRLGVRVSLDDFGTGYSSLSYLTSIPADKIKLDRSFLSREFASDSAVIQSVVSLAHRIGLTVVAEGVETRRQSERLMRLDCDEMQGFYFSRPLPAESVASYLDAVEEERRATTDLDSLRQSLMYSI